MHWSCEKILCLYKLVGSHCLLKQSEQILYLFLNTVVIDCWGFWGKGQNKVLKCYFWMTRLLHHWTQFKSKGTSIKELNSQMILEDTHYFQAHSTLINCWWWMDYFRFWKTRIIVFLVFNSKIHSSPYILKKTHIFKYL